MAKIKRVMVVLCAIAICFVAGCTRNVGDIQIDTERVTVSDKRDEEFTEVWLDKENAEKYESRQTGDFVITYRLLLFLV